MSKVKEHPLPVNLPFLNDDSILYVSNGKNSAFDDFISNSYEFLSGMLSGRGYNFISLRKLFGELSEELLAYLFPGADVRDCLSVQGSLQKAAFGESTHSGFIRNDNGRFLFCNIEDLCAGDDVRAAIDAYLLQIGDKYCNEILFRVTSAPAPDSYLCEEAEPESPLDERAQAILAELERIQNKYNISIEEFEGFLVQRVKLSHLHITPAGKIILTDFGNAEVKIDDLSKAVFFLYLKHPEGISYYDLDSYRSELMDLYMGITGKDDQESINRSIDSLVDRYNNSINVKVSRVKSAFKSVVSDRIAKFYYIDGPQGGTKKIPIDRDLVIWEH